MKMRFFLTPVLFLTMLFWSGCKQLKENAHEDHSGHSHTDHDHSGHDHGDLDHSGHDHSGHSHNERTSNSDVHEGEDEHDHESEEHDGHSEGAHDHDDEITVKPQDMKMAGITTAKVQKGKISTSLDLSGEVGFNEDRLVHITPRFPGIVKEVRYRIGEYVNSGETVAIIESNESMTSYALKARYQAG